MPAQSGGSPAIVTDTVDPHWPVYMPVPLNFRHRLNTGRVVWLLGVPPLDGGTTWWDLCGQYPGTLVSFTNLANNGWRSPSRSNAFRGLQFDGSASVVTTNYTGLSNATQCSIAMWYKRPSASTIAAICGAEVDGTHDVSLIPYSNGSVYFNAGTSAISGSFANNDLSWHRLLVSFDGTQASNATRLQMYLDGASQSLTFAGTVPAALPALSNAFSVGHDYFNTSRWANGLTDDVTVWNRPLSASEAWEDYELSLLGYPGVLNRYRPTVVIPGASAASVNSPILIAY